MQTCGLMIFICLLNNIRNEQFWSKLKWEKIYFEEYNTPISYEPS